MRMSGNPERSDFGPNQWLIDEMYRRFREDPSAVGETWRDFFEDYGDGSAPAPAKPPSREAEPEGRASSPQPGKPQDPEKEAHEDGEVVPLRGAAAVIAERMEES